ncbi:MAG: cation-translocating P-type ATPase [Chloroflexi bacterium]|nr:cation-translocating P-type ATPase [Chloroflexota bacterium]
MNNWHQRPIENVLAELKVDATCGLTSQDAVQRLAHYGKNELVERGAKNPWRILWEQFTATMVLILIAAAVVAGVMGDLKNSLAILTIVVLFGLLGFFQEYRAEKAMAALKRLAVPTVRVRRDGTLQEISARELVPGDIVLIEAGNLVPADVRLVESVNLRVQESALTGESEPIEKISDALTGDNLPLGDRRNMAYMGTTVTYGRGQGTVTQTGMQTELGKIATMMQSVERVATPMQKRLDELGKILAVGGGAVALLVFILGLIQGEDLRLMIMTGVSVAVAIVPEGLAAVVTITLALGARRMLERNALIRKLTAVETLGSVTVICSDKTGTLTENQMTVTVLDVAGQRIDLTETTPGDPIESTSLNWLLIGGALCNDATLQPGEQEGRWQAIGDPTEGALVVAAARVGLNKNDLDHKFSRVSELPFDSERKRMTTVHKIPSPKSQIPMTNLQSLVSNLQSPFVVFTKGATDSLLDVSSHVWTGDHTEPMNALWRQRIEAANAQLAANGSRVLGVAWKSADAIPQNGSLEHDLIFIGLVGMMDPPRRQVKDAVQTCKQAGIRPVMITGDHPLTARHIALTLGIAQNDRTLTGQELEKMTVEELEREVENVSVYARVSPEHKLKIVRALQKRGHIVAMTGDGVNDAPALRTANIGVAMGITGTDVSKEAADMVLRDDNFATIVAAVEEGRVVYANVRRFVQFSIGGNIGKILVVIIAPLIGMPLPLLPLQLLWLNLLTDGLLGLGLGVEPAERDTMRRPPRSPNENILGGGVAGQIAWVGALIGAVALGVGYAAWSMGNPDWQAMLFTTLALLQVGQALAIRSSRDSLFTIGLTTNRVMLGMALAVIVLQMMVVYVPFLQTLFDIGHLSLDELGFCLVAGSAAFIAVEISKWWKRRQMSLRGAT